MTKADCSLIRMSKAVLGMSLLNITLRALTCLQEGSKRSPRGLQKVSKRSPRDLQEVSKRSPRGLQEGSWNEVEKRESCLAQALEKEMNENLLCKEGMSR